MSMKIFAIVWHANLPYSGLGALGIWARRSRHGVAVRSVPGGNKTNRTIPRVVSRPITLVIPIAVLLISIVKFADFLNIFALDAVGHESYVRRSSCHVRDMNGCHARDEDIQGRYLCHWTGNYNGIWFRQWTCGSQEP
jgi:hypothetical protein